MGIKQFLSQVRTVSICPTLICATLGCQSVECQKDGLSKYRKNLRTGSGSGAIATYFWNSIICNVGFTPQQTLKRTSVGPVFRQELIGKTGLQTTIVMIEIDEDNANLEELKEAIAQVRVQIRRAVDDVFPFCEKLLNESDAEISAWKERALKAEGKVVLLERQLTEKHNQANQYKSSYEGQYQTMIKTGAVLAEVVWKSFKNHANVKMLAQAEETMDKFCALSKGIIDSFLVAFQTEMPPTQSLEHVLLISLLGALLNFAAFAEGRNFLAKEDNVVQLLKRLLVEQENWNVSEGRYTKRMVLTFAYNMTLVDNVAYLVLSEEKLLSAVLKCLALNDATDVVSAALAVIYRLLTVSFQAGIPSALPEKIPWAMIRSMTTSSDTQLGAISKSIVDLMETAAGQLP